MFDPEAGRSNVEENEKWSPAGDLVRDDRSFVRVIPCVYGRCEEEVDGGTCGSHNCIFRGLGSIATIPYFLSSPLSIYQQDSATQAYVYIPHAPLAVVVQTHDDGRMQPSVLFRSLPCSV